MRLSKSIFRIQNFALNSLSGIAKIIHVKRRTKSINKLKKVNFVEVPDNKSEIDIIEFRCRIGAPRFKILIKYYKTIT